MAPHPASWSRPPFAAVLTLAVAATAGLAVLGLGIGAGDVGPAGAWAALLADDGSSAATIVRDVRLPRAVLAILVGAALAAAGAIMQTATRNPLAEPGILGVTAGAAFAVTLGAVAGVAHGQAGQMACAAAGAAAAGILVHVVGRGEPLRLVLSGVALGAVLMGVSVGVRVSAPAAFDAYRFWAVGSLAGHEGTPLILPAAVVGVGLALVVPLVRPLEALALGDEAAAALGAGVVAVRLLALVLATTLAGVATALCGPIAFLGLIAPHVVRPFVGASLSRLLLASIVVGSGVLLLSDLLGRVLLPAREVPVSVVTGCAGGLALVAVVAGHRELRT